MDLLYNCLSQEAVGHCMLSHTQEEALVESLKGTFSEGHRDEGDVDEGAEHGVNDKSWGLNDLKPLLLSVHIAKI